MDFISVKQKLWEIKYYSVDHLLYTGNDSTFFEYIEGIRKIPIETDARRKKIEFLGRY